MSNPNHDPKTGEFIEGPGGSMGSAAHASGKSTGDYTSDQAIKSIVPSNAMKIEGGGFYYSKPLTYGEATKELKKAGFSPQGKSQSQTTSYKMGRTEAHYSVSQKKSTFVHPSGYTINVKTTKPDRYSVDQRHRTTFSVSKSSGGNF